MSDSLDTSPLADAVLTQELLDLIHQASQRRKARKGLNEVTKAVARGDTNVVILAADVNPIAIVLHLPGECERKDIPYVCSFLLLKSSASTHSRLTTLDRYSSPPRETWHARVAWDDLLPAAVLPSTRPASWQGRHLT